MSSTTVWNNIGSNHTLSKRLFIFMLTFWSIFGIMISTIFSNISANWEISGLGILGLFILSLCGIFISGSKSTVVALLGYTLTAGVLGLMLGPTLALYTKASAFKIMGGTGLLVIGLGTAGIIYPRSLERWSSYLIGALLILLIAIIGVPIAIYYGAPIHGALTWLDWIGIIVFSLLVIFDFNRAVRLERTHINAINGAIAIYLDFMNIFLRLVSAVGTKKD